MYNTSSPLSSFEISSRSLIRLVSRSTFFAVFSKNLLLTSGLSMPPLSKAIYITLDGKYRRFKFMRKILQKLSAELFILFQAIQFPVYFLRPMLPHLLLLHQYFFAAVYIYNRFLLFWWLLFDK